MKAVLFVLVILMAYGLVGNIDYEDQSAEAEQPFAEQPYYGRIASVQEHEK